MTKFVRPIHEQVEDLSIVDMEALCAFADNLECHIPDSLNESKIHSIHGCTLEESAYSVITIIKTLLSFRLQM